MSSDRSSSSASAAAASSAFASAAAAVAAATSTPMPVASSSKYSKRKYFSHGGREIYSWEQDIESLDMWITPPPGVTAKMIACTITDKHLSLGIKGNPPF